MKEVADHLTDIVTWAIPLLRAITDEDASHKPAPAKWSKKEIIGHLIDSACNNQMKFIRSMEQDQISVAGYEQNYWVSSQRYNSEDWQQLLSLWQSLNVHLAHVIAHIPPSSLEHQIQIDNSRYFTLQFIVEDYPEHLKHHLKAILPGQTFLENSFRMVY